MKKFLLLLVIMLVSVGCESTLSEYEPDIYPTQFIGEYSILVNIERNGIITMPDGTQEPYVKVYNRDGVSSNRGLIIEIVPNRKNMVSLDFIATRASIPFDYATLKAYDLLTFEDINWGDDVDSELWVKNAIRHDKWSCPKGARLRGDTLTFTAIYDIEEEDIYTGNKLSVITTYQYTAVKVK